MTKPQLDRILDDQEKDAIAQFLANDVMCEAVKKVLLSAIYQDGVIKKGKPVDPLQNLAFYRVSNSPDFPNEHIGAEIRAIYQGVNRLVIGFQDLETYKQKGPVIPRKENPAR